MTWFSGVLALVVGLSGFTPIGADAPSSDSVETHCVVHVVDQRRDGEFVLDSPTCFADLPAALEFASDGGLSNRELAALTGSGLMAGSIMAGNFFSFTLGTHFDGYNGTGSSISVVGSSCTGGWWNTGVTWANRISSSWNGCYRLRHYNSPNKFGTWADTTGVGQTDNLPSSMNNRTESVAYFGS
jgi:hypothetical protein